MSNLRLDSTAGVVLRWAALVCALTACNAQVKTFSAVPRYVCAGDPVQLQWNVVGSASVTLTPSNAGLPDGPVESEGHATIRPATRTNVALRVERTLGNPTTSTQEIEVTSRAEKPEPLTASLGDAKALPGCRGGIVWATIHVQHFATDVRVATVVAHPGDKRSYDVRHEGRHATVAPGTSVTTFDGTAIKGDWVLTAPLAQGQTCATVPSNLVVDVIGRCVPEQDQ